MCGYSSGHCPSLRVLGGVCMVFLAVMSSVFVSGVVAGHVCDGDVAALASGGGSTHHCCHCPSGKR